MRDYSRIKLLGVTAVALILGVTAVAVLLESEVSVFKIASAQQLIFLNMKLIQFISHLAVAKVLKEIFQDFKLYILPTSTNSSFCPIHTPIHSMFTCSNRPRLKPMPASHQPLTHEHLWKQVR